MFCFDMRGDSSFLNIYIVTMWAPIPDFTIHFHFSRLDNLKQKEILVNLVKNARYKFLYNPKELLTLLMQRSQ